MVAVHANIFAPKPYTAIIKNVERPVTLYQRRPIYQQQADGVLSMYELSGLKGILENTPSQKTKNGRNE